MARKKQTDGLTALELELMKVLWRIAPANVQSVREALAAERELAYTTVQTMLNILERKGKVARSLEGRAYVYRPTLSRAKAASQAAGELIDRMFGGSPEKLVLHLVESSQITPEQLAEIQHLLDDAKKERTS